MTRRRVFLGASALVALVALGVGTARATSNTWSLSLPSGYAATPTYNIGISNGAGGTLNVTLFAYNDTVSAVRAETGSTGSPPSSQGSYKVTSGTISKFPVVVPISGDGGVDRVFFTSTNGYLYKLSSSMAYHSSRDFGRHLGCVVEDSLVASPTLLLKSAMPSLPDDMVIIATKHGCGDHTLNQVIALPASGDIATNTPYWTFNEYGEYQVDYFSEGCSVDYTSGRETVYCGTHLQDGRAQNTLWGINAKTGQPRLWANANSIHNRPHLGFKRSADGYEHLYVADQHGILHAFNPAASGEVTDLWQVPLVTGATTISTNIWAEFRAPYNNMVLVTDSAGSLHAVYDDGDYDGAGSEIWTYKPGASSVTSLGSVSPSLGKLFVGTSNGLVRQLSLATGAEEAYVTVNASSTAVTDPTLAILGGATDVNRLVAGSYGGGVAGSVKQFPVPFPDSSGADLSPCSPSKNPSDPAKSNPDCTGTYKLQNEPPECVEGSNCCSVQRCDPNTNKCYLAAITSQATRPCNDSNACTGYTSAAHQDHCQAGKCVGGDWDTANGRDCSPQQWCPYDKRACGPGKQCFSYQAAAAQVWGCMDTTTGTTGGDDGPCGSLARVCGDTEGAYTGASTWGGGRKCVKGRCERDGVQACGGVIPTAGQLLSTTNNAHLWASGLTFDRLGSSCSAWIPTYQDATNLGASTTLVTLGTPSTSCTLQCGTQGGQTGTTALAQGGTLTGTFADPAPAPGSGKTAQVVGLRLRVYGNVAPSCSGIVSKIGTCSTGWQCTGRGGALTASLNGYQLVSTTVANCNTTTDNCDTAGEGCKLLGSYGLLAWDVNPYPGTWNSGGTQTVTITSPASTGGYFHISHAEVLVYRNDGSNEIRKVAIVSGSPVKSVYQADPTPGFMHGVAAAWTNGSISQVWTSFVNGTGQTFTRALVGLLRPIRAGVPVEGLNTSTSPPVSPAPVITSCVGACPFTLSAYNKGPTGPASNEVPLGASVTVNGSDIPGALWYGNYLENGDVHMITASATGGGYAAEPYYPFHYPAHPSPGCSIKSANHPTCVRTADCPSGQVCWAGICAENCTSTGTCSIAGETCVQSTFPATTSGVVVSQCVPKTCTTNADCTSAGFTTCTNNVCVSCERVNAVAIGPANNTSTDNVLKVAVGSRIYHIFKKGSIQFASVTVNIYDYLYVLDLASSVPPASILGGGSGVLADRGLKYTDSITSMTVDPLNRTKDLYVTTRETRPINSPCTTSATIGAGSRTFHQILHVRGDDHAVRTYGRYYGEPITPAEVAASSCVTVNGALRDAFPALTTVTTFGNGNDAAHNVDARITASSGEGLYVLWPVDPADATGVTAISKYRILP